MASQRSKYYARIYPNFYVSKALERNRNTVRSTRKSPTKRSSPEEIQGIRAIFKNLSNSLRLIATSLIVDSSPNASNNLTSVAAPIIVEYAESTSNSGSDFLTLPAFISSVSHIVAPSRRGLIPSTAYVNTGGPKRVTSLSNPNNSGRLFAKRNTRFTIDSILSHP